MRTPSRGGRWLARCVLVLVVVAAGGTSLLGCGASSSASRSNADAAAAGHFDGMTLSPYRPAPALDTLRNYDGTSFNLTSDRGKAVFVTFLYTHCPDVCPLIASTLHAADAALSPERRARVAIVAISVDPRGDTPAAVAAFLRRHGLVGEATYLIGSASELVPVWRAWNVGSERDVSHPDRVDHTALIYGIGASGRLVTAYTSNVLPHEVVHDVPALLES